MTMQLAFKHILCPLFLAASLMMHGRPLPSLDVAKEISKGRLPNGIEYYLVTNPSSKGFADYALAKKSDCEPEEERNALEDLSHFAGRKAHRFLAENGVGYSSFGLISHSEKAGVYSFRNVPVHNQSVADSTLLMVMDIAAKSHSPQAIVISGDINAAKIKERMELLSMTVSRLDEDRQTGSYIWQPRDTMVVKQSLNLSSEVAMIRAIYSTERLPRENLNTAQPLLTRAYASILSDIFTRRIRRAFREAGVPLAHVETLYSDSAAGPEDERYQFSVYTSAERVREAGSLMASVLSGIDRYGAAPEEFRMAKKKVTKDASRRSHMRYLSNEEYVDKCISSYLYGTDLASPAVTYGFIAANNLPLEQELPIFNSFASALIDSAANLALRFDLPSMTDLDSLALAFGEGWNSASNMPHEVRELVIPNLNPPKQRIKKESSEPVSGGRMLTFANGIRVIYKQLPTEGEFRYSLMLRGGSSSVPGLNEGEAPFVGDMLKLCDVAGMKGWEFREALEAKGITMDAEVRVSDMRISGLAPSTELPLLISALKELGDSRAINREAFETYRQEEALRLDMASMYPEDVRPLMDSLLRPDYHYSDPKNMDKLHDDLPERAAQSFDLAFSKVNDGLLVLVGDFDEEQFKKDLSRLMGAFSVQNKYAQRPRVPARLAFGSVTHKELSRSGVVGAEERSVNVAFSAAAPFSVKNYMCFKIAAEGVRLALVEELADCGAYVDVLCRNEVYPIERISMFIRCRAVQEAGLPSGMKEASSDDMLAAVRRVTSDLESVTLSDKDLKAFKTRLISEYESSLADPEGVIDAVLIRYSDGRDVVTGYKEAINSVSKENIRNILQLVSSGAEVEYIIE